MSTTTTTRPYIPNNDERSRVIPKVEPKVNDGRVNPLRTEQSAVGDVESGLLVKTSVLKRARSCSRSTSAVLVAGHSLNRRLRVSSNKTILVVVMFRRRPNVSIRNDCVSEKMFPVHQWLFHHFVGASFRIGWIETQPLYILYER